MIFQNKTYLLLIKQQLNKIQFPELYDLTK